VREFDSAEIPTECYGGEETLYSSNCGSSQQKFMKLRNAYLLIYKRKLVDESKIVKEEGEAEASESKQKGYQLGAAELKLDAASPLCKKIAAGNRRYWQNRYLFSAEYFEFVQ
jgi:adenylate cyclase class IV